jgi:hypothetical protein
VNKRFLVGLIVGCVGVGCADEPAAPKPEPEVLIRPTSVTELTWPERSYALPTEWAGSTHIQIAEHPTMGTLVGGPSGLFRLQGDQLVSVHEGEQIPEVDEGAVYGLSVAQEFVWVASENGLSVFDGVLRASPISDQLPEGSVRAIAQVGEWLWIALEAGVFAFDGVRLSQLTTVPGVFRITRGGEGLVSVTTVQGESFLLKVTDDGLMQQDLGGQGALRDVVPLRSDRVFALEGGTLRVRVAADTGDLIWRRATLSSDEAAEPVTRAWSMSPTIDGAGVWLASPDSVSRWVGETIEQLATPIGIGSVMRIHPMANGQLWLVGAERMVRLGADDQPPPTYCADIDPYFQANCSRCHNNTPTAQASNLDGYAIWSERYESIYSLIQAGAMPKDAQGRVDGEALYMLQRWQEGGMIECE